MKRKVTVTFDIDPEEYIDANDTSAGVVQLVDEILQGNTDWPEEGCIQIHCQDKVGENLVDTVDTVRTIELSDFTYWQSSTYKGATS